MIKVNDQIVEQNHFPDGTLLIKQFPYDTKHIITWKYENDSELFTLICLVGHLRSHGVENINLNMPYIPHARQDRVKNDEDVFTLKYFCQVINSLNFTTVKVLDVHSNVSLALLDRVVATMPLARIERAINNISEEKELLAFYPDEGAMKRYSSMIEIPYAFGIKRRDWATGKIEGLDVAGCIDKIKGSRILIVDDICSRGGTFYHSAKKLKELGAKEIYLYITHCENTILEGELLISGLIEKVYTTNSIFTKEHEKIEVFEL